MRTAVLLFTAAALAAGPDLTPRDGSGWRGFGVGTSVRMKRTATMTGRAPTVQIWTTHLAAAEEGTLTLETKAGNALGMEETTSQVVPATGEAGVGEREKTETLGEEEIAAAGKTFRCQHTRTVVTQPAGRRTIDKWIAADPLVWVKRVEIQEDGAGKVTYRSTWMLKNLAAAAPMRERKLDCVAYDIEQKSGEHEFKSVRHMSRLVPGGTVRDEGEIFEGGKRVQTYLVEVLDVEVK